MAQSHAEWRRELRAMVALAVPVVLSELGWVAQGVVDNIMVGRLGPAAIGAVSLGNAIYYTPSLFGIGLLLGLDTLVSQAYGRNDHDECHRWLAQGVYLACIVTVPIMILLAALSYGLPHFGVTPDVAAPASSYLRVLLWSTLPLLLYGGTRRYLQGVGQVRVITVTYVLANLLNWGGNWVLIYGKWGFPAMGVDGSALSTCIARVAMAIVLLGFAWRYERSRGHPLFRHWSGPQLARLRQLARIGAPAAGQILLEVGAWNLSTFSASYLSPVELATHAIALNYASISYMVPLGVSAAAAVSVGHAVGANHPARARRAGWLALGLGTAFMLCAGVVFFVAPRALISLYTSDPRVLIVGPSLLWIAAAFQIFDGIQTVCTGALRGLGETRAPMIANFVGYWILGLPLGLTLCFILRWGIYGTWIGLTLALVVISLSLLFRWRKESRRIVVPA
ncbi:MAG TPA: MATE family efflux transporter [Terracidiphilus sp.]|jgi:MATE family multidrug resistance protein|nr:MATE family efflux transporter [Terracidiphilus sp.]